MNLEACPFKKGMFMKVPKGTPLFSRWSANDLDEKTTKDVVVEISGVFLPSADSMLTKQEVTERQNRLNKLQEEHRNKFLEMAVKVHYPAQTHPAWRGGQSYTSPAYTRDEIPEDKKAEWERFCRHYRKSQNQIQTEYNDLGLSRMKQDEIFVSWSKDSKTTRVKYVELAEKPEARKKQPKVNVRQQMVPKSRWKVIEDKDIYYGAENPAFTQAMAAWDKANPRPDNNRRADHDKWHKAFTANREHLEKTLGRYIPTLYTTIKAGTIFEVTGKFLSYWNPFGWGGQHYGNVCPALFDGAAAEVGLEYNQIKDFIEAESIPTVKSFVLRHKPTGQFYSGHDYGESKANLADTFMKGKKWDNLGKAKTSILMMTGYYDGLPGADEALPEWSGGDATMTAGDLRQYELVEFDKLGRSEVGAVAEFQDWFERSWQLRELTMKYGSSVRQVYKALEKAKMLDQQKGVAVFTVTDEDALDRVGYWGDRTALTDEDKDEIKLALASVKGKFKQAVDHKSAAVSFPDKGSAMMFKLAYSGNLKVSIIDLEAMKEAVGD